MSIFGHLLLLQIFTENFRLTHVKKTGHFFFSVPFLKKKFRSTAKIKKNKKISACRLFQKRDTFFFSVPFLKKKIRSTAKIKKMHLGCIWVSKRTMNIDVHFWRNGYVGHKYLKRGPRKKGGDVGQKYLKRGVMADTNILYFLYKKR